MLVNITEVQYFLLELTEYLLSKGLDFTVKTKTGDSILHGGVHGNKPTLVDLLIKAGKIIFLIKTYIIS